MKPKILVVDDDLDFLEWLDYGLKEKGDYEIYSAETMEAGWKMILKVLPDIAIIDIKLPDGDGFELTKRIRQNAVTSSLAVLLVTGVYREIEYKEKGYTIGADDFLVKPFSYAQLAVRIARQLQKKKIT